MKSFYSNYGISDKGGVDVSAPGGDSPQSLPPLNPNGRVLSTYSTEAMAGCLRPLQDPGPDPGQPVVNFCYLQGTSMASPHVAGVAALVISRFGDLQSPQNGKMRLTQVEQYVQQTADHVPGRPDLLRAFPRPAPVGVEPEPQACQGGTGSNSWYGTGQVDVLDAVTHNMENDPQPSPSPLP